jgi:hypothetical protein
MSSTPNASNTPSRTLWTPEELEQMVQWLEEPSNQSRFKKESGLTKKAALAPLASQLSSRTAKQIFDKYCNIKKSRSKAARLNDQSGWGLTEEDLAEGTMTQRGMFKFIIDSQVISILARLTWTSAGRQALTNMPILFSTGRILGEQTERDPSDVF